MRSRQYYTSSLFYFILIFIRFLCEITIFFLRNCILLSLLVEILGCELNFLNMILTIQANSFGFSENVSSVIRIQSIDNCIFMAWFNCFIFFVFFCIYVHINRIGGKNVVPITIIALIKCMHSDRKSFSRPT